MKKHTRKPHKTHKIKKRQNNLAYLYVALIILIAALIFLGPQNRAPQMPTQNLEEEPEETVIVVEEESPEEPIVEEPSIQVPEGPTEQLVEDPIIEIPTEPEADDTERALQMCTDLCVGKDVDNGFKRRECAAECDAVFENYGREALNKLIAGLQR